MRISSPRSRGIASRIEAVRLIAGIVRVAVSRLTDTSRPTAPRLKALMLASTTITRAEDRNILELSRMPSPPRTASMPPGVRKSHTGIDDQAFQQLPEQPQARGW